MKELDSMFGTGQGDSGVGIYGTLTRGCITEVFRWMTLLCGLNADSYLVDAGAGLGRYVLLWIGSCLVSVHSCSPIIPSPHTVFWMSRPQLHALVSNGVTRSMGIEIDQCKVLKALGFIANTLSRMVRLGVLTEGTRMPEIVWSSFEEVGMLYGVCEAGWGV